jgi:hypothetical protein
VLSVLHESLCELFLTVFQRLPALLAGMAVVRRPLCKPDPAFAAARRATASENLPDAGCSPAGRGGQWERQHARGFSTGRSSILLIGGKNRIYAPGLAVSLVPHRHSPMFHEPASTASVRRDEQDPVSATGERDLPDS